MTVALASCAPPNSSSTTPALPAAESPAPTPTPTPAPEPEIFSDTGPTLVIEDWTYPQSLNKVTAVDTSYPAVSCALTDNRPTQNLMAAIQKLSDAVRPKQECAGDVDLQKANDQVARLAEAVKGLNQFWQSPELLSQAGNMAQFQSQLEQAMRGIDAVGRNFTGNALLNSKCAQSKMGVADIFIAFTDLVTAFAPFALIGASMNPSLGVALPYVLGITGAGSAAKIVNKMLREQGLDTSQPEVRAAILANICEYMKIAEKIRFLKLAQSGQLEFVTREISSSGAQKLFRLYQIQTPNVKAMIQKRNLFLAQLDSVRESFPKDQSELLIFKMELQGVTAKPMICEMSRSLVNGASEPSHFPGRAIANYRKLVNLQPSATLTQQALVKTEENLRAQFITINGNSDLCAQVGQSYIETISKIVSHTGDLYRNAVAANNSALASKDKAFGVYISKEARTKREIETISRVTTILQKLNQDNAVIDKVEMHSQMLNLKRALFSKPSDLVTRATRMFSMLGWQGVGSPALEYLKFIADEGVAMIAQYSQEINSLMDEVMYHRPLADPYLRHPDGSIQKDKFGYPMRKGPLRIGEESMKELEARQNLSIITPISHPVNSESHARLCRRLENIWLAWASVMDHLAAQSFFCSQIRSLFDAETDRDLVQLCDGRIDINGKQVVKSGLQQKQSELAAYAFKDRALMVSEKLRQLSCKMPDGLTIMQGI